MGTQLRDTKRNSESKKPAAINIVGCKYCGVNLKRDYIDCARINKENKPIAEVCDAIDFYTAASNFYHGAIVKDNALGTKESKRVSEFQEKRMNSAREYFSTKIFS